MPALLNLPQSLTLLGRGQCAVDKGGRDLILHESIHLVFHQCNQGRNDQCHPVHEQRRQLVTERFAASRGHDHDRISLFQEGIDDLLLPLSKTGEMKLLVQDSDPFIFHRSI